MFPYYYSNVHHTVEKASEGFLCVELAKGFFRTPYGGPQVATRPSEAAEAQIPARQC